ncbi:MAG: phosphatidylinositol alpha-mannosyltransferase [Cyclobacteriaceae bacterium]|jgi:phosphatidylinositol alpha-mannosyltransferase
MKIAQICPYDFSRPGGVRNHILGLSEALRLLGHQVDIITPNAKGVVEIDGVHYIGKSRSTSSRSTKVDYSIVVGSEYSKLHQILKSNQYDVIHYHNAWTPLLTWQILFLSFFKKNKNIATFHDTPKDGFIGKYVVGKILMPFGAIIISMLMNAAISVSKSQSKYISGVFFKPLSTIPNGINLSLYSKSQKPMDEYADGKFNLVFMGRIEPRKGLEYALKAFESLKPKYRDLRLIIAGDGDGRLEAQDYVEKKGLVDVEFLGFVDEMTKYRLLNSADIYLAPALFGESFGIVLLEAMAAGIPMVGFGNEGYNNVVEGEWQEYFPHPRNQLSFTQKIEKLYLDPAIRKKMVKWGKKEVEKYDWNVLCQDILKIYDKARS